jgi:hypothetical protein
MTVQGSRGRPSRAAGWAILFDLVGERLIAVWLDLFVLRGLRRAWKEHHLVLRAAAGVA